MSHAAAVELIDRLFQAFNRHDEQGVVALMTEDAVFETAVGPEMYGARHTGRAAIAAAFAKTFADLPNVRWDEVTSYPGLDGHVTTTWIMRATRADGLRLEVEGVDLFTIRDGQVALKRAFRKDRPAQPA